MARILQTLCVVPADVAVTMAVHCASATFKVSQKYQTAKHQMRVDDHKAPILLFVRGSNPDHRL